MIPYLVLCIALVCFALLMIFIKHNTLDDTHARLHSHMEDLTARNDELEITLAGLARRHAGYSEHTGGCECEWHQKTRKMGIRFD